MNHRLYFASPLKTFSFTLLLIIIVGARGVVAFAQQPFSLEHVLQLIEAETPETDIINQVEEYKVDFALDTENMRALIRAGASDALLEALERNPYRDLTITFPANGAEVGATLTVEGRSRANPGKHLWLFAHRKGLAVWWPQIGEILLDADGSWIQSAFLGQARDVGFDFEIRAIWVDAGTHNQLTSYLAHGAQTGSYPGMALPAGSPSAQITVEKVSH